MTYYINHYSNDDDAFYTIYTDINVAAHAAEDREDGKYIRTAVQVRGVITNENFFRSE